MKEEFKKIRKDWKLKEISNQRYLDLYYALGKKYNLILYYPL